MNVVVDASVAAKWFLPEARSDLAARLLSSPHSLIAPELMRLEVGNTLLKAVRNGLIEQDRATTFFERLAPPLLQFEPTDTIAGDAFALAREWGGSVYDAVYVRVAEAAGAIVATDDRELARTARSINVEAWLLTAAPPPSLEI